MNNVSRVIGIDLKQVIIDTADGSKILSGLNIE